MVGGTCSMKTEQQIRRRLVRLEAKMREQTELCMENGWHSGAGVFWDGRCVERRTLRSILGMAHRPFNAADTLAGV